MSEPFNPKFAVTLGQFETGEWGAIIHSASENKHSKFAAPTLKMAMNEAYKRMRKRELLNKRFPPPEPSRLITLADSAPRIISRNGK